MLTHESMVARMRGKSAIRLVMVLSLCSSWMVACGAGSSTGGTGGTASAGATGGAAGAGAPGGTAGGGGNALGSSSTCLQVLQSNASAATGTYNVSVEGAELTVFCDMTFAGGGWTLVESTNGGTCAPATATQGMVAEGSCAYLPAGTVEALAARSTVVHIRAASGEAAPTQYLTSTASSIPIQNLVQGLELSSNLPVASACPANGTNPSAFEQNCPT